MYIAAPFNLCSCEARIELYCLQLEEWNCTVYKCPYIAIIDK